MGLKKSLSKEEIVLVPLRIPVVNTRASQSNFEVGFSSTLPFVIWAVWGGFIYHMILSNYLAILMKPVYDKAIRNVDDVLGSKYLLYIYQSCYAVLLSI